MKTKIEINFFCESKFWPRRLKKIKEITKKIMQNKSNIFKKKNFYFLNLIFIDDKKIRQMNKLYRNINSSTDVLTFVTSVKKEKNINYSYCDIFFSAETIKKDSKKNLINFYDHLTHLIIHCFLHVNGYDHKKNSDFSRMRKLEEKILLKLKIASPYNK
tara:strand:- start:70 stop:546 length:477 start_codon:yes stop_codon:yes gene_type:complete